jgi:hypothetical protein
VRGIRRWRGENRLIGCRGAWELLVLKAWGCCVICVVSVSFTPLLGDIFSTTRSLSSLTIPRRLWSISLHRARDTPIAKESSMLWSSLFCQQKINNRNNNAVKQPVNKDCIHLDMFSARWLWCSNESIRSGRSGDSETFHPAFLQSVKIVDVLICQTNAGTFRSKPTGSRYLSLCRIPREYYIFLLL